MDQHRTAIPMGGLHHFADVMAVDRSHVREAQLLEHSTNLGHRQTTHAALEAIQFSRELTAHEGQMANAFLNTAGYELHRD